MKIVRAENVSYEYTKVVEIQGENVERKLMALDNINIDIEEGSFIAVLGHNGSGKSTFAKHINALITPSSGTVWVDGYLRYASFSIRFTRPFACSRPNSPFRLKQWA